MSAHVTGSLLVDGRPAADQQVLLVSEEMKSLLAAASTGADGRFELVGPDGGSPAVVLARVADEVVTVAHRALEPTERADLEIRVDTDGFVTVDGRLESEVGWPPEVDVFLDPVGIEGVPRELARFFKQRDHGVFDARFATTAVAERTFRFRVRPGLYRIGGEYIVYDRPAVAKPRSENFIVDRASSASRELSGDPYGGFELPVERDTDVVLSLRTLDDSEL